MRFKTLLLGSATAFAFAGGSAQAADLSVAEPVDYVRVCDAFGAGYWYIPGTDTCVAIGGEVEFRVYFEEGAFHDPFLDEDEDFFDDDDDSRDWNFRTQFDLNVTTKSMTDWGPLTTFINLTSDTDHDADFDGDDLGVSNFVEADEYYLSLGPVLLGLTQSTFDVVGGGLDWTGQDLTDNKVDQVQLSWAFNGFGIVLAAEDSDERWGSFSGSDMPDLVAALTAGGGGWEAKVSVLYSQDITGLDLVSGYFNNTDDLIAVQGGIEFDVWGDQLLLGALWAEGPVSVPFDFDWVTTNGWAVLAGYQHNWSSNLWSSIQLRYVDDDNFDDQWDVHFTTAYSPVDGLWVGGQVGWYDYHEDVSEKDWDVILFAERKFGP